MILTEPFTSIFGNLNDCFFEKIFRVNSRPKKSLANDELQENRGLYWIGRHRKQRRL